MEGSAYHGWKFGLPDKFWPVTLDNFFDNCLSILSVCLTINNSLAYATLVAIKVKLIKKAMITVIKST